MNDGASTHHTSRLENIDLLRGVAALLVVWAHVTEEFIKVPGIAARGIFPADAAELLGFGRMGVVAFFAISGYVVVPTVSGPRTAASHAFLVKRFFRLYPPFWFSMAVAWLALWLPAGKSLSPATILANATMLPVEWSVPQIMGNYWTLEIEFVFYVLVLALFWSGRLHTPRALAFVVVLLTVTWAILAKTEFGRPIV